MPKNKTQLLNQFKMRSKRERGNPINELLQVIKKFVLMKNSRAYHSVYALFHQFNCISLQFSCCSCCTFSHFFALRIKLQCSKKWQKREMKLCIGKSCMWQFILQDRSEGETMPRAKKSFFYFNIFAACEEHIIVIIMCNYEWLCNFFVCV